jgi:hypothetical protein
MNLKSTPRTPEPLPQHLTHDQLCDLLLHDDLDVHALHGDAVCSTAAVDQLAAHQEHIQNCLICGAELELLRDSIARFHALSDAFTSRELARRPLNWPFSSLLPARRHSLSFPAFAWAAVALIVASVLPLSLMHLRPNTPHRPVASTPAPARTSPERAATEPAQDPASDAALLESINQDLSAAVPTAMEPLASPAAASADAASGQESN